MQPVITLQKHFSSKLPCRSLTHRESHRAQECDKPGNGRSLPQLWMQIFLCGSMRRCLNTAAVVQTGA